MSNRLVENEHPSLKGEKSIISSSPASLFVFRRSMSIASIASREACTCEL